ncbi:transcription repressor OFP13-like [Typha latifolia]|uniref:transcription repressor OFP13-like n=1 Tax=Typha latifolia TaxID=4733 RepID=UPI003C2EB485
MIKKLGFTSLFFFYKSRDRSRSRHHSSFSSICALPASWPSSSNGAATAELYKTNSNDSCLTNSVVADSESFSTVSEVSVDDAVEAVVVRGLKSDRLFFEPGCTSSILEDATKADYSTVPLEGSVAMAVDSEDPYRDFRASMEEMVMAHGVADWEWLQEMLGWYLRANGKNNHGVIIGAFADLLLNLSSPPPPPPPPPRPFPFEIEEKIGSF